MLPFDLDRRLERAEDPLGDHGRLLGADDPVEQDRELVAAETRHRVRRADGRLELGRDVLEDAVARGVAHAVVDGLEVVQVDEHHADERSAANGRAQCVLHAVGEESAVGEIGHRIVECLMCELVFEDLALADVSAVEDDASHRLVVQEVGVAKLESQPTAVGVLERAFESVCVAAHLA